jgi:hypothetical protein
MLPFIWLSLQVRFVWAIPSLVQSDDPPKEVVTFPLVLVPLCDMAKQHHHLLLVVPDNSFVHYDLVQLKLFLFRKHVVRALELGSCTSRWSTMQLSKTQPEPLTALLQLYFCYQPQTALVPPEAHLSCYSSVATTFYPTFVFYGSKQKNCRFWRFTGNTR